MSQSARHFLLVHGACLGAWSWNVLATKLKSAGHTVSAIDLNGAGINPVQISDITSNAIYIQPLIDFMAALSAEDKVVLVGHSAGGYCIAPAMEQYPQKISVAVFLTALMPGPTVTLAAIREEQNSVYPPDFYMDTTFWYNDEGVQTSALFGPNLLATKLFPLSPPEDLTLANLLARPWPIYSDLITLTEENYGSVPRVYIKAVNDLVVTTEIAEYMLANNPPDDTIDITGSDHMVMYSQPEELYNTLQTIIAKYP